MIRFLPSMALAFAGATALGSMLVHAQDPAGRPTQGGFGQDNARDDANRLLATWLLVDNKLEVELSQLAQQKAEHSEVKEFAQRMVQEHQQLGQKLQPIASSVDIEGGGGRPVEAGARRSETGFDHVALVEELGNRYLESGKKLLDEKQGAEFDKAFIGMQVAHHMKTLDTMEVFEKHASGELEPVIQQGQQVVEKHLREAKQLADKVMKGSGGDKSDDDK